jgi:hypothetical protein
MHTYTLRIDDSLAEKLRAEALADKRSVNAYITNVLSKHIDSTMPADTIDTLDEAIHDIALTIANPRRKIKRAGSQTT